MNKVTEMFLQYLRHNQEKVKHQKVSLIAKYQKCNKVNENFFDKERSYSYSCSFVSFIIFNKLFLFVDKA